MKGKEIVGSLTKRVQATVRLPGADEPKNAFQVFKQQFDNFSEWIACLSLPATLYPITNPTLFC